MYAYWPVTPANLLNLRGSDGYSYIWVLGILPIHLRQYYHYALLGKGLEQIHILAKKYTH